MNKMKKCLVILAKTPFLSDVKTRLSLKIGIKNSILNRFDFIDHTYQFTKNHAVLRNGSISQGVIVYGVDNNALKDIFNLNSFSNTNNEFKNTNGIIIGEKLASILSANLDLCLLIKLSSEVSSELINNLEFLIVLPL